MAVDLENMNTGKEEALISLYNKLKTGKKITTGTPELSNLLFVPWGASSHETPPTEDETNFIRGGMAAQLAFTHRTKQCALLGCMYMDKPTKVLDGTTITCKQAFLTVKSVQDLATPLFISVDVNMDKGTVILNCNRNLYTEGQTFAAHWPLYYERILGSAIWSWVTEENKNRLQTTFCYCDDKNIKRVVELPIVNEDDEGEESLALNDFTGISTQNCGINKDSFHDKITIMSNQMRYDSGYFASIRSVFPLLVDTRRGPVLS